MRKLEISPVVINIKLCLPSSKKNIAPVIRALKEASTINEELFDKCNVFIDSN